MRILGIDCGGQYTGYGVVEQNGAGELRWIDCGAIVLCTRQPLPVRLQTVFSGLGEIIERNQPELVAIEEVFYAVNPKSALKLGQVRGVAMLAAAAHDPRTAT